MQKNINMLFHLSIVLFSVSMLIMLLSQWHLSGEPNLSFNQEIQEYLVKSINNEYDINKLKELALELVEEKESSNSLYNETINIVRLYSLFISIFLIIIIFKVHIIRKEISNN